MFQGKFLLFIVWVDTPRDRLGDGCAEILFRALSPDLGEALRQETLNFRQRDNFVPDGVGSAKLTAFDQPMDGDIGDAQDFGSLAHGEGKPGEARTLARQVGRLGFAGHSLSRSGL